MDFSRLFRLAGRRVVVGGERGGGNASAIALDVRDSDAVEAAASAQNPVNALVLTPAMDVGKRLVDCTRHRPERGCMSTTAPIRTRHDFAEAPGTTATGPIRIHHDFAGAPA